MKRSILMMTSAAGLGAALMYMFDPTNGARRRERLRKKIPRSVRTGFNARLSPRVPRLEGKFEVAVPGGKVRE